jgi:hypothetical protein
MAYIEDNPRYHLVKMRGMLHDVMRHCREDMDKIGEPKAQALFETTAEVLNGLITTYSRYETEVEEKDRRLAA